MLLKQRREAFDGARWLFEPKWDGWRALATVQDGRTLILRRNGRDLTSSFSGLAEALSGLPSGTVLGGELVVLDGKGRPDFDALMRREGAPCLLAFDLLRNSGRDVCAEPIEERKRLLADLVAKLGDVPCRTRTASLAKARRYSRWCRRAAWRASSQNASAVPTRPAAAQAHGSRSRCQATHRIGGTGRRCERTRRARARA